VRPTRKTQPDPASTTNNNNTTSSQTSPSTNQQQPQTTLDTAPNNTSINRTHNETTRTLSQPQPRRPVTRGAQLQLSGSLRSLSRAEVFDAIKNTTIGSMIRITIASPPDFVDETIHTRVIALDGAERTVEDVNDDDSTPCQRVIPFATTNSTVITRIDTVNLNPLHVVPTQSTRKANPRHTTIFYDGGAQPNPGPAAAAIVVVAAGPDGNAEVVLRRSRFYPRATNNQMESIASLAAMRQAERMLQQSPGTPINVVGDSLLTYNNIVGSATSTDRKLKPHLTIASSIYRAHVGHLTICHMLRDLGNPADKDCNIAIRQGRGNVEEHGDTHLFADIDNAHVPAAPPVTHTRPAASITDTLDCDTAPIPKTLHEFAQMYRFKSRNNVPDHCVDIWSQLVHHQLTRFANAPGDKKEDELIRFMMLPTWFLPRNASASRVLSHLQRATPFITPLDAERRPRQHSDNHRLTEAVTRLVADHKMRSANQLLSSAADAPEMPFEEKVEGMKKKLLQGSFSSDIPRKTVPLFSPAEVAKALRKCSNQAANAIDGWSKRLLEQAISVNPDILQLLGDMLHFVLTGPISQQLRQGVTLARGVALPKPEGKGIRPICISNVFLKMLGLMSMERDGTVPSELQYAIGTKEGARRVIHKVRKFIKNNPHGSVLRFDISNAYGTLRREVSQEVVKSLDATMQQYFRLVYGQPTSIAMFGPNDATFLQLGEGVKQGDATSSLLFCLGIDRALKQIQDKLAQRNIKAEIYMYMDDLTVCVAHQHANTATRITIDAFNDIGLKINEDKSKILCDVMSTFILPQCGHNDEFVILGANISTGRSAHDSFMRKLLKRQENYFDLLDKTPLHPQIKSTILRICGHPRILYHCATSPPRYMQDVASYFDGAVALMYERLIDPSGHTKIPTELLHDVGGLGVPHYSANLNELYGAFERMSLEDDPMVPRVSLTTTLINTTTTQAQTDAQWMFYEASENMTPAQFCNALAIRLNLIPRHLQLVGTKCNCGYMYTGNDSSTLDHLFSCARASPVGFTHRHDSIRDTIIRVARNFGITCSKEPACFTYTSGQRRRPDVLFHTEPSQVAIDVSLVSSTVDSPIVEDIKHAEREKKEAHRTAVEASNARFFPFVMATRGLLGVDAESLIRTLARAVQPFQQTTFSRRLHHAVAVAAAKGRSDTLAATMRARMW
jgi:ribonuclease HI